jgi:hypothetical protein
MRFYDTRVLLLPRDGVNVQWQVEGEDDDLTLIEVELQRSESPHGPFTPVQTLDPLTAFSFTDRTAPWRSKNFELYYQLVGRLRSTGEAVSECPAFGFQGRHGLDALEIIRQHHILLYGVNGHEPLTGIRTTVYKKRTFGPRCRECTDESTGQVVVSQCRSCGGTGFAGGGYYTPIIANMNFQPTPRQLQITNLGKAEDNETTVFTTNFPIFYAGDMVVEPNERHWRVVQIEVTERKRVIVHQLLRLRQLDHNDIEYEMLRHLDN